MKTGDTRFERDMRNELRQASRYPLAVQRDCTLCIITFKDLAWSDHVAHLKDISANGVGLESEKHIEAGFVWFRDRVGGHRGGVIMWSQKVGYNFRAGIQLAPLSREEEQFVQDQVGLLRANQSLPQPEAIMSTVMESLVRGRKH